MRSSWLSAVFFDQGKLQPRTNIGRILGVGYLFGLFLLLAAYTANLASMLVSSARDENSVDSMEDAIERRLPICVVRDTTSFRVSIEEYPTLNTVLHDKVDSSFFGDVVEGKCAGLITARYVWDNSKDVGRRNPQCLLGRIGNSIETFPVSFISQSDPYRDFCTGVLSDVVTLTLQEMALEHWISGAEERVNAITADQDCPSSHEVEPSGGALGLKDLMGIFVIQLATCIVVLIGHFFCPWCKDAEDKSKDSESSE